VGISVKRLLLCLAALACTKSVQVKTDEHVQEQDHKQTSADTQTTETVQSGPETITTTVEEFEAPEQQTPSVAPPTAPSVSGAGAATVARFRGSDSGAINMPPVPILVKRTITVDQRGTLIATTATNAKEAVSEDLGLDMTNHTKTATKTRYGPSFFVWIALAAGVVAAGWAAYKFTPWGRAVAVFVKAI
jgi:hypothetical protein